MKPTILGNKNVCTALPQGLKYLVEYGQREESRAGPVLVAIGPVLTVTQNPQERVLFSAIRDANPFFHLREALWMLAGRDDVEPLTKFVKGFTAYAEPGGEVHGAYGRRWRYAFGFDQLDHVVNVLKRDPTSRQCVIQMWDAHKDDGNNDLRGNWKDRPCNTHIYLRIRDGLELEHVLDLTVCCRSNDAIWGAHGANAVHFSILQEYLAARIDVGVGVMYQLSNNYHVYDHELARLRNRIQSIDHVLDVHAAVYDDRYSRGIKPQPMFDDPDEIDNDLRIFEQWCNKLVVIGDSLKLENYVNRWFRDTASVMMVAHALWKHEKYRHEALRIANTIEAPDWRIACVEWLQRRVK